MTASRAQSESGLLAPFLPGALIARLARQPIEDLTELIGCTMVFADVSGFTRLSERLARRGREGAEQLVDVINTCFSALLAEAYGRGGSLVKFGGDAMLLVFYDQEPGQQHAQRACCAAAAMRRRLREVGRIRAGDTNVVLRMSVGVHSGEYALFVVGGSHRELLIGGPAASAVVELEAAASSGQILIGPGTARLLPRSCVGRAVGPGALLIRPPAACEWVPPTGLPNPPQDVVASFLPPAVRTHLLSGSATPEHRTATIAFLQYVGLDEVIARDGTQSAAPRLDELLRLVQDAAERYDVCFLDSDIASNGGKIRLSAGAPRAVGDDEERMLLALRHIVEADPPLPVRVGVHRGPVFTGPVGPDYRRWYAVMGDTVNLAARLGAKAPVGRIYATQDVLRQAKTSFEQSALEPFAVKGKTKPVQAWNVGRPVSGASSATIRMELPLVGREREVEQLRVTIEAARHGSGRLVELSGETGSGKSRLLAEASRFAEGLVRLRAACEVYTRDTPYHTWRGPLRALLGARESDPESVVLDRLRKEIESAQPDLLPWLSLIAIVFDLDVAPSAEVEQLAAAARVTKLHDVVLRFLRRALVVPTMVEIEQGHLMDAASLALFEALARELESSAWVVVATRRDTPGGMVPDESVPCVRIEVGPLSREDTMTLALATPEATQVPPHVVELAVARSGGSPEFLLDLLAAAASGDRDELPDNVGAATMARIDALDPRDRAVVRRAAALGLRFHPRQLTDVLAAGTGVPEDGFWDRLGGVFAREPDGHLRFRRPALQEVAYGSLPFKLRRELHLAVGLRLEHDARADPAVLSHHFARAGDHARAYRYAMAGAERATERFSHADAARLYQRAIDARRGDSLDPTSLARAWERLGEALRAVGEPEAASRALTQARQLCRNDPLAQARLCHLHASVAHRAGAMTAAVRWLKRGLRAVEGLPGDDATASRARTRSLLAGIRNLQGRWTEAITACRQAIAEAESAGESSALARAYYNLDWALVESGRSREATYSWRALEIYERLGDPEHEFVVLNNLGMFAYFEGRWDEAVDLYRRAGEAGDRAGMPANVAFTDGNVGEIRSDQGRLDEAEAHLAGARRIWTATGDLQYAAYADVLLARLAVRRGRFDDGRAMLQTATAELQRLGADWYAEYAQALIAEAEAFGGNPVQALDIASRTLEAGDRQRPLLTRMGGIALARLGQTEAAARELGHSLRVARERKSEYDVAAAIDALDLIGAADPVMLAEREQIQRRLKITRLPRPALA